ncbi:MAG TPA: hypothetical protein VMA77_10430 [Solirubrobacteraceae bacterium]|nr:hypothetical protein [Solirubrobacteraceae bacterium]
MSSVHDIEVGSYELTPSSVWRGFAGAEIDDELLEWPADLFALSDLVLQRSEAHRFALSPPSGASWPPDRLGDWATGVADAGRSWSAWVEDHDQPFPELLAEEWAVFRSAVETPLSRLGHGHDWRLCEAVLTLHAIADEACSGLGVALTASDGYGAIYRARGRELLARKGSLSRAPVEALRVLPKVRTAPNGTSLRTLSRYVGVFRPGVETHWHKVGARLPATEPETEQTTFLLLPWPLRVRESDFRPVPGSVRSLTREPFGYFEFAPSEELDLDLLDRTLTAALDETDHVQTVILPESAVDESQIDELERVLAGHRIGGLIAGVRGRLERPGELPSNWVHYGRSTGQGWQHMRQQKHHRWSLDEGQIDQYHLVGALHPHIRWWEAMEVPRRSIHFVERADGAVLATIVCEDLAQIDEVAEVVRSVGPTIVVTPLLDGPQLSSRWAARYASVLADDPGSAVLTLTSYGMARRSRPNRRDPSSIIALWKDPVGGTREIPLEAGAQGVLLTMSVDLTVRRSGDGRQPVENCLQLSDVSVFQVRAAGSSATAPTPTPTSSPPAEPLVEPEELTILRSWAEAVAEVLASAPEQLDRTLADMGGDAGWRARLGIEEWSAPLAAAVGAMRRLLTSDAPADVEQTLDRALAVVRADRPGAAESETLARDVLRLALEQRRIRHLNLGLSLAGGPR